MTKLRLSLLALFLLVGSSTILAYDAQVDGIYYNLKAETLEATVSGVVNRDSNSVEIPGEFYYNGALFRVTSIGKDAFSDCSGLQSVTIPNSVTTI